MYELLLADDLFPKVMSKEITNTIRKGKRDAPLGMAIIEATDGRADTIKVNIWDVKYCKLNELTVEDLINQGHAATKNNYNETMQDFLQLMQRFYPTIDGNSIVTVINFDYICKA